MNHTTQALFTELELKTLHPRFGHPSTTKLLHLLRRAHFEKVTPSTRLLLQNIVDTCDACQRYAPKPYRFRFTLLEDKEFNHSIYVDIFYIDSRPVLHVVDEATRYQAAQWL